MMTTRGCHTPVRYPAWQREYEAAILNVDPVKVNALVSIAHAAIQGRVEFLSREHCPGERDAIANALMFLRLLTHPVTQGKSLDLAA